MKNGRHAGQAKAAVKRDVRMDSTSQRTRQKRLQPDDETRQRLNAELADDALLRQEGQVPPRSPRSKRGPALDDRPRLPVMEAQP